MSAYDVVVVGRGMMGAAAARHLTRAGVRVALVGPGEPADRRSHAGVFASHYDSGRITRTIDSDPDWALLAKRSIARYAEIEADSGLAFFSEVGCVIAGPPSVDEIAQLPATIEKAGANARRLGAPTLQAAFPGLRFPNGFVGFCEMQGAGTIDPRALGEAQTRLARRAGATILCNEVTAVRDHGRHVAVETADGTALTAERAIAAAGAFCIRPSLVPKPLDLRVKARTVLMAEVGPEDAARYAAMPSVICAAKDIADSYYVVPPVRYPDGRLRIKIGGDPVDRVLDTEAESRAWSGGEGDPGVAAHLRRHLEALLPAFRPVALSTAPCVTTYTRHGHPYIGASTSDSIIVLTGGNGTAAKSSDEIGRLGAVLAATGRLDAAGYATSFAVGYA